MTSLIRAIAAGTFRAEDFTDADMQRAVREGLVEYDRGLVLTDAGHAVLYAAEAASSYYRAAARCVRDARACTKRGDHDAASYWLAVARVARRSAREARTTAYQARFVAERPAAAVVSAALAASLNNQTNDEAAE